MREDGITNTSKRNISYLRLNDVLFSVRMLISNRTWVSSFIISSRQTAVFFWQSIGNARIDGRIWKVTKSTRDSRAEPEEKKSSRVMRSLHLRYVIQSHFRMNFWQQTERNYGVLLIGKSGFSFWYPDFGFCDKTWNQNQISNLKNPLLKGIIIIIRYPTYDITKSFFCFLLKDECYLLIL